MDEAQFLRNLKHYKTAFSPSYDKYVRIVRHFFDSEGEVIIVCLVDLTDEVPNYDLAKEILFRREELSEFVL